MSTELPISWTLIITDHDTNEQWAEGPLGMLDGITRRDVLWDSEPGRYSIETYLHRNPEEKP